MEQARVFTLEEALALLPLVRRLVEEIQEGKDHLDELTAVLDALMVMTAGNGRLSADIERSKQDIARQAEELERLLQELQETGAELKGIEEGLIDFPSQREGRIVYLCWRLGEETITWWHDLDTGFAGRQPL